jgi:hypothetical protein
MYPFEPWRIKHNTHHAHTNKYASASIPKFSLLLMNCL